MRRIWPPEEATDLDDQALETLYRYPSPNWLVVNFVASVDGAVSVNGRAGSLSDDPDRRVLKLGSDLADVLLVGATTAMVEEFRGYHPDDETRARRRAHGLVPVPPTAVVTTGRSLPVDAPVITEAEVPSFVITPSSTPEEQRAAWVDAGATVLTCGTDTVDLGEAVRELADRGLGRIDSEGGPHLFGALLAQGLVDELRVTASPVLVSGAAGRIVAGVEIEPASLELASVVAESDTLLMRYLIRR